VIAAAKRDARNTNKLEGGRTKEIGADGSSSPFDAQKVQLLQHGSSSAGHCTRVRNACRGNWREKGSGFFLFLLPAASDRAPPLGVACLVFPPLGCGELIAGGSKTGCGCDAARQRRGEKMTVDDYLILRKRKLKTFFL
jgi:hypothetical protein